MEDNEISREYLPTSMALDLPGQSSQSHLPCTPIKSQLVKRQSTPQTKNESLLSQQHNDSTISWGEMDVTFEHYDDSRQNISKGDASYYHDTFLEDDYLKIMRMMTITMMRHTNPQITDQT